MSANDDMPAVLRTLADQVREGHRVLDVMVERLPEIRGVDAAAVEIGRAQIRAGVEAIAEALTAVARRASAN